MSIRLSEGISTDSEGFQNRMNNTDSEFVHSEFSSVSLLFVTVCYEEIIIVNDGFILISEIQLNYTVLSRPQGLRYVYIYKSKV